MNLYIQQIHCHDRIHNYEYHYFYYHDSQILTIAQLYCMFDVHGKFLILCA